MNSKQKTIALSSVLFLTLTLALGGIYLASAQTLDEDNATAPETPFPTLRRGFRHMSLLSDELRAEMNETVQEMRDAGASSDEIRMYVESFLEENGVETKKPELSEEQLELYRQLREDIKTYAQQRAGELGLELPENGSFWGHGGFHGSRGHDRENTDN